MTVTSHLGIRLADYDVKIRTFIPAYDDMLDAAARALLALPTTAAHIVDAGTGTGALAARCLQTLPDARVTALDEDADILELARQRLDGNKDRATTVLGNFLDTMIPECHAIVGSLTFHHLRTPDGKREMYRRFRGSLVDGGLLVIADCCPSADERLAACEREAWRAHLALAYSEREIDEHFAAWAREDVYFTLAEEMAMLAGAGFHPEVAWRRGAFAVIAARRD